MVMPRNSSTQTFAECLCQYREQNHWTRKALADQMGVSVATVGNWERGDGFPRISSRDKLCELLGKTLKDLHLPPFN